MQIGMTVKQHTFLRLDPDEEESDKHQDCKTYWPHDHVEIGWMLDKINVAINPDKRRKTKELRNLHENNPIIYLSNAMGSFHRIQNVFQEKLKLEKVLAGKKKKLENVSNMDLLTRKTMS